MKFSLEQVGGLTIRAYDTGRITVVIPPWHPLRGVVNIEQDDEGNAEFNDSFIISREQLTDDWAPQTYDELQPEHLTTLLAYEPELILLGTGAQLRFPNGETMARIQEAGVGLEVMDTAAACRTFNILVAEGRNVVAALMMI
ncbi:MAG: Mth938-like domain-containing protein [Thiohalophilus sp.]|uniref:Mth938-like domain-containing protein n=1 Tax=Thiohalophilus sp. TaxID=3028392 RepID=UPI0028700422|nr:Mth938-like domain-containing protein [Thiohalophilus sp.]MDR9437119.1 Mth938-like domain-containing protein [Thiohalophilus sp.]